MPPGIYRLILLVHAKATNKAQPGARHLHDQGAAPSWEGRLLIKDPET
jgi:hypothetical protein